MQNICERAKELHNSANPIPIAKAGQSKTVSETIPNRSVLAKPHFAFALNRKPQPMRSVMIYCTITLSSFLFPIAPLLGLATYVASVIYPTAVQSDSLGVSEPREGELTMSQSFAIKSEKVALSKRSLLPLFVSNTYPDSGNPDGTEAGDAHPISPGANESNPQVESDGKIQQVDLSQKLRNFLSNPPWIKNVVFLRSKNYYINSSSPKGPRHVGFTRYQGVLQAQNFYLKHLSNSIMDQIYVRVGLETIFGSTERYFWHLESGHDVLRLAPRRPEDGQAPNNSRDRLCRSQRRILQSIQRLGIDPLAEASLHWTTPIEFTGTLPESEPVVGKISRFHADGLPAELEFEVRQGRQSTKYVALLSHSIPGAVSDSLAFLPREIVYYANTPSAQKLKFTNIIEFCEVGEDHTNQGGYTPSQFRSKPQPIALFVVSSNSARYQVSQSGGWEKIEDRPPMLVDLQSRSTTQTTAAVVVLLLAVSAIFGIVCMRSRIDKQHQPKTERSYDEVTKTVNGGIGTDH